MVADLILGVDSAAVGTHPITYVTISNTIKIRITILGFLIFLLVLLTRT